MMSSISLSTNGGNFNKPVLHQLNISYKCLPWAINKGKKYEDCLKLTLALFKTLKTITSKRWQKFKTSGYYVKDKTGHHHFPPKSYDHTTSVSKQFGDYASRINHNLMIKRLVSYNFVARQNFENPKILLKNNFLAYRSSSSLWTIPRSK